MTPTYPEPQPRELQQSIHIPAKRFFPRVLVLLLALVALLDMVVALRMSPTADEHFHLSYGNRVLHLRPDRLPRADSHMPISALNALPHAIASYLDAQRMLPVVSKALGSQFASRLPTVLASVLLILFIFLWVSDLYGTRPALAACLLGAFSPSLIAHGSLATSDMYHAVGVVGSLYFVRRYLRQPATTHLVLAGLALALAQLTKPFALSLYAVVAIVALAAWLRRTPGTAPPSWNVAVFVLSALVSFVVVINIAYSFDRTFTPLGSYQFKGSALNRLQQAPLLRDIPVPLPYPFLQGIDMMKYNEETGVTFGNIYLWGRLGDALNSSFGGFKSYYVVAAFFKEPIALQILFIWGLLWIWRNRNWREFLFAEGLLLTAAAILLIWFSFFSRAQIGIRHILPVLAVEIVIAAAAFSGFSTMPRLKKAVLLSLVLWLLISTGSYFPHMIPYMNEWSHDRRLSYRFLADSNLDWSQSTAEVQAFLNKNRDVILNPEHPVSGRVLVNANRLTGVDRWHPSARWLAEKYQPVAHVAYSHFLFEVPAKDVPEAAAR